MVDVRAQSADDVHILPRAGTARSAPDQAEPPAARTGAIRVAVDLVEVPVVVTDHMNRCGKSH